MTDKPLEQPDVYDLTQSVGYHLHRLATGMRRELEARLLPHEVTAAQWGALVSIGRHGCRTGADLARWTNLDKGAISRVLAQLESAGLIARKPSRSNRRQVDLSLTSRGKRLLPKLEVVTAGVARDFLAPLEPHEVEVLVTLLQRLPSNHIEAGTDS